MNELKINLPELIFAWLDETTDNTYYLDTAFGDIKLVNRNLLELRDLTDEIEKDRERFMYVPKPDKNQLILDLKEFWATVPDEKLRNILSMAFESPHLLSSFKKILESQPSELSRFNQYRDDKTRRRIEEWLASHSVKYSLI